MISIKPFFPMIMALEKIGVSRERMRIMTPLVVIGQILGLISLGLLALHFFRQCKVEIDKSTLSRLNPLNKALSDLGGIACGLRPGSIEVSRGMDGYITKINFRAQGGQVLEIKLKCDITLWTLYNAGMKKKEFGPEESQARMLTDARLAITLSFMGIDCNAVDGMTKAQGDAISDQDFKPIQKAFKAYVYADGQREALIKAIEDSPRYAAMLEDRRWYSPIMDFAKGKSSGLMIEKSKVK